MVVPLQEPTPVQVVAVLGLISERRGGRFTGRVGGGLEPGLEHALMGEPARIGVPVLDLPHQLELAVFAVVDAFDGSPPERGLWRVSLEQAVGQAGPVIHPLELYKQGWSSPGPGLYGPVKACHVLGLGAWLYLEADKAGVIDMTTRNLVSKLHQRRPTVISGLAALTAFRLLRRVDRGRRRCPLWAMNLGTLDWPAVRARARGPRVQASPRRLDPVEELPSEDS